MCVCACVAKEACFHKIASLLSGYRRSSCKEGDSVSWGTLPEPWPRPLRRPAPAVTELQTPPQCSGCQGFGHMAFLAIWALSTIAPSKGWKVPCQFWCQDMDDKNHVLFPQKEDCKPNIRLALGKPHNLIETTTNVTNQNAE